jgi:hypothetical protein
VEEERWGGFKAKAVIDVDAEHDRVGDTDKIRRYSIASLAHVLALTLSAPTLCVSCVGNFLPNVYQRNGKRLRGSP